MDPQDQVVVEKSVLVPTRDGCRLATDIYRKDDDAPHPVLLCRTPYNKDNLMSGSTVLVDPVEGAQRGYVVVIQDVRGRSASEGRWSPFFCEAADGHDTIFWILQQPWSNGRVGLYGNSYMGVAALQAAIGAPSEVQAVAVYMTGADYREGWLYSSGVFELGFNLWWALSQIDDALTRPGLDDDTRRDIAEYLRTFRTDPDSVYAQLPVRDLIGPARLLFPHWDRWLDLDANLKSDKWHEISVVDRAAEIRAPILHIAGWFDGFLKGHIDLNAALTNLDDAPPHAFVIGPWAHESYLGVGKSYAGDRDFGPGAPASQELIGKRVGDWFDTWLDVEGTDKSDPPQNAVSYFVMGEDRWIEDHSWPPTADICSLYLTSDGAANSMDGDGSLASEPVAHSRPDIFVYDPSHPVPTIGGRVLAYPYLKSGIKDQAEVERRHDVLVYTGTPLSAPLRVVGPVRATLFVRSSAATTDFTAKLVDVGDDGYCAPVADGIKRVRSDMEDVGVHDLDNRLPIAVEIDLWDTAYVFDQGHRVRLEVSSSNFPRFARNPNIESGHGVLDDETMSVAVQYVFHSGDWPSRLLLPIVVD